jgi:hypothetical protein
VVKPDHQLTGGNPGGCLLVRDADGGDLQARAPQKFLGDLSRFLGGNAWFDARRLDESDNAKPHAAFGELAISNGKRTLRQTLFHPTVRTPRSQWTRFSGRITPEAFATDEATLKAVLASVTRMTLTLESVADQRETIGLDNFTLQGTK